MMRLRNSSVFALWLFVAILLVVLDQASKHWVLSNLALGESRMQTSYFNIVLVFNAGAAFSFLADAGGWQKWFFIVLAMGISAGLVLMLYQAIFQATGEHVLPTALSLVLGGAIGNVIDRLRFDAVVDFLDFHVAGYHWPAFNVADSAISIGVALLLLNQFRQPAAESQPKPKESA